MPRVGLSTEAVIAAAADLADEVGLDRLTLTDVAARVGVRQPSLYKHVAGLEAVRRGIGVRAKNDLADALALACVGVSGADAVVALGRAYRTWALAHPGRYACTVAAPAPDDAEDLAAADRVLAVVTRVLAPLGLDEDDTLHAVRGLRAMLHGFLALEQAGGFGLDLDVHDSFEFLLTGWAGSLPA